MERLQITNQERFGFYLAYEHAFYERILEVAELPFTAEAAAEVKAKLPALTIPLKGIGIEVTRNGDYLTVWGPGVRKHG